MEKVAQLQSPLLVEDIMQLKTQFDWAWPWQTPPLRGGGREQTLERARRACEKQWECEACGQVVLAVRGQWATHCGQCGAKWGLVDPTLFAARYVLLGESGRGLLLRVRGAQRAVRRSPSLRTQNVPTRPSARSSARPRGSREPRRPKAARKQLPVRKQPAEQAAPVRNRPNPTR